MAKKLAPFNRFEPLSSDLIFMQDAQADCSILPDEVKDRIKDQMAQPGILVPRNATAIQIQAGMQSQFALTTPGAGLVNIGAGIAYTGSGERIEILSADSVTFNPGAPAAITQGVQGTTPFSTGHMSVPYSIVPGETTYYFISYLPVVRTMTMTGGSPTPPDHNNQMSGVPAITAREPVTGLDQDEGLAYAHHMVNGYVISYGTIATGVTVPPVGTPYYLGDSNGDIYIYLGNITAAGIISMADRKLFRFRPTETATVAAITTPTLTYVTGQTVTAQEHVSAVGHGTVSPTNPHAMTLSDMGETISDASQFEYDTVSQGLVDKAQPINAPVTSLLLAGTISGTQVTFANATDTTKQTIYIAYNGHATRYNTVYSTDGTLNISGNAVITSLSFLSGSPNYYTIYAYINTGDNNKLYLNAVLSGTEPTDSCLPLAKVYWTGSAIQRGADDKGLTVQDLRVFGLVSTQQLSTSAMTNITTGTLSNQGVGYNMLTNGLFRDIITVQALTSPSGNWNWHRDYCNGWWDNTARTTAGNTNAAFFSTTTFGLSTACTVTTKVLTDHSSPWFGRTQDTTLLAAAKTTAGIQMTFGTASNIDHILKGLCEGLKPDTIYTVSMYIKASVDTLGITIDTTFSDYNVDDSTRYAVNPQHIDVARDNAWRRVAVQLRTKSTIPISRSGITPSGWPPAGSVGIMALDIRLGGVTTTGTPVISLAKISVTEGPWLLGSVVEQPFTLTLPVAYGEEWVGRPAWQVGGNNGWMNSIFMHSITGNHISCKASSVANDYALNPRASIQLIYTDYTSSPVSGGAVVGHVEYGDIHHETATYDAYIPPGDTNLTHRYSNGYLGFLHSSTFSLTIT